MNDDDGTGSQKDGMEKENSHEEPRSQNSLSPVSGPDDNIPFAEDGQVSNAFENTSAIQESVQGDNKIPHNASATLKTSKGPQPDKSKWRWSCVSRSFH